MAIDTTLIQTFTFEDVAKAMMHCIITGGLGGANVTINGRSVGRYTPEQARETYDWAIDHILARDAGENGSGNILVRFGETQ